MPKSQTIRRFVTGGGRLSKEEVTCECPDALWSIVVRCWSKKTTDGPTFCCLVAALQTLRDKEVSSKMLSAGAMTAIEAQERAAKEAQERSHAHTHTHVKTDSLPFISRPSGCRK